RYPAVPALPRRTRVRPAQPALAHPPAHHRQPQQNRRHRTRCPRPDPFRAWLHHMNFAEITSLSSPGSPRGGALFISGYWLGFRLPRILFSPTGAVGTLGIPIFRRFSWARNTGLVFHRLFLVGILGMAKSDGNIVSRPRAGHGWGNEHYGARLVGPAPSPDSSSPW